MAIFQIQKGNKLTSVKEEKINLEKDIQKLTEKNLPDIFGLTFVKSEFSLQNFRIDTLAFDPENRSFVIIEYKRDRSFSVVDQGYAYLSLMLNNKDSFILEYIRNTNKNLDKIKIDWSQSRVIFIANSFTSYQQNAINFKDLPIELWEAKKYDNNIILFNQLKSPDSSESINTVSNKNKTIQKVSKEVKHYSTEDHFKGNRNSQKKIFEELRPKILEIDSRIEESPQKVYIGYKIGKLNVISLGIYTNKIVVDLCRTEPKDLKDPEKKVVYRKNSYKYFNQHISRFTLHSRDDIDYASFLIKQVYERFIKL